MNYNLACQILELSNDQQYDIKQIKKQYHKLALFKHPDKNGNTELSNIQFREIHEAYTFFLNNKEQEQEQEEEEEQTTFCFQTILSSFIQQYLQIKEKEQIQIIINIVYKIMYHLEEISIHIYDQLNKETAFVLYSFLSKYKFILHISDETLHILFTMLQQKYNTDHYTVHPSIQDIFENNIYPLHVDNKVYIVPLWHNEMNFQHDLTNEIIVFCQPHLPPHISIDEDNNILVQHTISSSSLLLELFQNHQNIHIELYSNKIITLPLQQICLSHCHQTIVLKKQGISKIKTNIYDIQDKSDIIIDLLIIN